MMRSATLAKVYSRRLSPILSRGPSEVCPLRLFRRICLSDLHFQQRASENEDALVHCSMKSPKLRPGFLQDGEIGISILPQGKKLLILDARVACVAGDRITPSQAVTGQH
jgi:hypothetical protein